MNEILKTLIDSHNVTYGETQSNRNNILKQS